MFFKVGVLKNVTIFTGKHCVGVFFGLQACNFTNERLQHRYFVVNIVNFLRNSFHRTPLGKCYQRSPGKYPFLKCSQEIIKKYLRRSKRFFLVMDSQLFLDNFCCQKIFFLLLNSYFWIIFTNLNFYFFDLFIVFDRIQNTTLVTQQNQIFTMIIKCSSSWAFCINVLRTRPNI